MLAESTPANAPESAKRIGIGRQSRRSCRKPNVRLICGDALTELKRLRSESVQCCVTSPPFYLLRDYQCKGQIGHEPTVEGYVANLVGVCREVRRVLRPDGTLWLNIAESYVNPAARSDRKQHSIRVLEKARKQASTNTHLKRKSLLFAPFRLATALEDDGWIGRCDIVVQEPNPAPDSVKDRPTRTHQYVLLFSKQANYFYDGDHLREPYAPRTLAKGYNQVGDNPDFCRRHVFPGK